MASHRFESFRRFEHYFVASGIGINILCLYGLYQESTKEYYVSKIKKKYITDPLSMINKAYMIELENGKLIQSKSVLWNNPPHYWDMAEEGKEYKITINGFNCPNYGVYPNLYQLSEK